MDSIIESWTCQVEGDLATFFEQLHDDVTTVWMYSRIGHRSPGCKPVIGDKNAYFTFTGDAGALAAITARMYRPGWLVIVIDRCRTEPEDIDPEYATWAEIGQKVTTWLRGWIQEKYNVEPVAQRAGRPSWDDYSEPATPTAAPEVQRQGAKAGNPGRQSHAKAIERLRAGEGEKTVRADWRNDYAGETGLYPDDTQSGEAELWRKNVKSKF